MKMQIDCEHCAYAGEDPREDPCMSCVQSIYRGEGRTRFKPMEEDNVDEMISVSVYADTTGLFTEEECNADNMVYLDFPRSIVEAFYQENKDEFDEDVWIERGIAPVYSTFDIWYNDVYTCDSTEGLCVFAKDRGFVPERKK